MSTEVPKGWSRVKAGDVLSLDRSMIEPQPDAIYTTVGVRSFGNGVFHYPPKRGDELGALRFFRVRPGCLFISNIKAWEGAVSVTSEVDRDCLASNRFLPYVGDPDRIDVSFLYYYFAFGPGLGLLQAVSPGSADRNRTLGIGQFESLELQLPPLSEQKQIVGALSEVDKAIDATLAAIAQAKRVRSGLLHNMLASGLQAGWKVMPLGEIAQLRSGGTPARGRADFWGGGIPWVKTGSIDFNWIETADESLTDLGLASSAATVFPAGTVVMAMYGQGATRGRVARLGLSAATNQACVAFLEPKVSPSFLYHVLAHRYDELRRLGREGTQKNLSAAILKSLMFPVPSPAEQLRIVQLLESFEATSQLDRSRAEALQAARKGLLQDLLTGKVRVRV